MKSNTINFGCILILVILPKLICGQDVRFYYEGTNYSGPYIDLFIGQSQNVNTDGDAISIKILNPNAAVKATRVAGNWNPYSSTDPRNYFVYTVQDMPNVGGTNQYEDINIRVECLPKANNAQELPQPTTWIPVDRNNVNDGVPGMVVGQRLLMVRRAYLWENSEDAGCCAGPYGSVGLAIYPSNLLTNFNFNFTAISSVYCGAPDINENLNSCSITDCQAFNNQYPTLGGLKLPGPIFNADNPCNDFGAGCGIGGWSPDDPKSEWTDWPWGVCYSRIPIFNWSNTSSNQVSLVLREGDDTNCDDFMGGVLVDKDNNNIILFKAWSFGWLELQNITVTQADIDYNIDIADKYWNFSWDGYNPEEIHSIPQTPPFDQFVPLAGQSILEMEAVFSSGSTIGLLGGKFPIGILSKPMMYKAACQPAVFSNQ